MQTIKENPDRCILIEFHKHISRLVHIKRGGLSENQARPRFSYVIYLAGDMSLYCDALTWSR